MFQQFQNLMQNQSDPKALLNQMTSKYNSKQMEQFMKFANGFGISNEQLSQYGIGTNK